MHLPELKHLSPGTVEEAVTMLSAHKGESAVIAGGSDLIIKLKQRLTNSQYLVDIKRIPEIVGIVDHSDDIEVGALTKLNALEVSPDILKWAPLLAKAASLVGGPQHRSMGTLGGNICLDTRCYYYNQSERWRQSRPPCYKTGGEQCYVAAKSKVCHAVYSGDTAPALIAQDARIKVVGSSGSREEAVENLFTGDGKNPIRLEEDSIIASIIIPKASLNNGFGYEKHRLREAVDFPVVGVAALVSLDGPGGVCQKASIVLNAVGSMPIRVIEAEEALVGRKMAEAVDEASELAYQAAHPIHKMGGSPYYKKKLVRALTRHVLMSANSLANEQSDGGC